MRRLLAVVLVVGAVVFSSAPAQATSCDVGFEPVWTKRGWKCIPTPTTTVAPTTTTEAPTTTSVVTVPSTVATSTTVESSTTTTSVPVTTTVVSSTVATVPPAGGSSTTSTPPVSSSPSTTTEPPTVTLPDDCIGTPGFRTTRWTFQPCEIDEPYTPPVDVCLVDGEPYGDYLPGVGDVLDRRGTTARFFQPCHLPVPELPATGAGVAAVALIAGGLVFVGLAAWAAALKGRAN